MKKECVASVAIFVVVLCWSDALAITVIDGSTLGFYNQAIGTTLDTPNGPFPGPNLSTGDPTINNHPEPDLSLAAGILGGWRNSPPVLNANWSSPQFIPTNWPVNSENAIIYPINAGPFGLTNVNVQIGVDNGAFGWLNGNYLGGHIRPGGAVLGELTFPAFDLTSGQHHLQILREDHGGGTGFSIRVTGNPVVIPLPAAPWMGLFLMGAMGAMGMHRAKMRAA